MTPTIHATLMYLAEQRAVYVCQYEDVYAHYVYARRVRLPALQRLMGREMQALQAAITLHNGLRRAYCEEVGI